MRPTLSVRAFMVLVLVVGGGPGWFVHRVRVQREAVAAIEGVGGAAQYDFWPHRDDPFAPPLLWPRWLLERVGPDVFGHVRSVGVDEEHVEQAVAPLLRLQRLEELHVSRGWVFDSSEKRRFPPGRKLTRAAAAKLLTLTWLKHLELGGDFIDADLVPLQNFAALESLELDGGALTDASLVPVGRLVQLNSFALQGVAVTSAVLRPLHGLSRLKELRLTWTTIDGLEPIRHLAALESLDLEGSPITDEGLEPASHLSRLKNLDLAYTEVTDASVRKCLRNMPSLEKLNLRKTRVTDAVIPELMALPRLQKLDLAATGVTEAGLAILSHHPVLAKLKVSGLRLSEEGLERLLTLKSLNYLVLPDIPEKHARFMASLAKHPHLSWSIGP